VRFNSVGDEFSQPLFFTFQSLHPRVVFLIFSVCEIIYLSERWETIKKIHENLEKFKVDKLKKISFVIRSATRQGQTNTWSNLIGRLTVCAVDCSFTAGKFSVNLSNKYLPSRAQNSKIWVSMQYAMQYAVCSWTPK
jgi:hypothetical protein